MNRLRRWSVVCPVLVVAAGLTAAADPPPGAKASADKWLVDRTLTVTPAAEPQPALKYRLLPVATELKEGNAVPIYLRLAHEQRDETRKQLAETPQKWNELPLDQVPLAEARKFLDGVLTRYLDQFDYGARRKAAEWNYTLEQPDPISILLPDVQQMRQYAPMMVLRARVDIAGGKYGEAARAFETGFAFSRHVANGPFLISSLVGVAIASQFADRVPEWIERPGSPNLYWSLTALPRPLIDLRTQLEFEQGVLGMQFRDLADLDRPRTSSEWDATLRRFRAEVKRLEPVLNGEMEGANKADKQPPPPDPDQPAAQSPDLVAARKFVADHAGKSAAEVAAMPPAQVLLLYISGSYSDLRDNMFKLTYLPFAEALPRLPDAAGRLKAATGGEGVRLAKLFLPAVAKVMMAQVRLDRRVALLRAVEALRLYAAAHGGELPQSLDQVTEAPVPPDPGTGKPYESHRDGAAATLVSKVPGEPLETTGLRYRVTIRK
jgi:hypothetical protein